MAIFHKKARRSSKIVSMVLIAAVFLSACQTTTRVNIDTNVPGAQVVLDGKAIGTAPITRAKIKNSYNGKYNVTIEKEGYETLQRSLKIESKAGPTTALVIGYSLSWLILPALLCINAFWITGPEPNQYFVLTESTTSP
jgi:hypothetical protein